MKTMTTKKATPPKTKNACAKMRKIDQPYEIWKAGDWEWRVLKKWQANDEQPYARWFCAVKSDFTYGKYEYGDVYAAEIKSVAIRTYKEEAN